MLPDDYFDMRNLSPSAGKLDACPVTHCAASLEKASSQWGDKPWCPIHRIRIHSGNRTFVYYNGSDEESKRNAASRNILFERDYFRAHILGNPAKAETHRICNETSEDALTWNVFSALTNACVLNGLLSQLSDKVLMGEPELYLWGLRIRFGASSTPEHFRPLENARITFEKGISRFLTKPDIMLYFPGQLLVLVEAKFTSGNTLAKSSTVNALPGEKPISQAGILERYSASGLPSGALLAPPTTGPFYSQLYRNLAFAIHMAAELEVPWGLVSLVSEKQFQQREVKVEFQDPSRFVQGFLPEQMRSRFRFYSWERLFTDHVARNPSLTQLSEYMATKSANGEQAFRV